MKNENDILYEYFQQANEDRKRSNFNYFMSGLKGELAFDLDELYSSGNMNKYNETLQNIKEKGIRIFRNSDGKHKIKMI